MKLFEYNNNMKREKNTRLRICIEFDFAMNHNECKVVDVECIAV